MMLPLGKPQPINVLRRISLKSCIDNVYKKCQKLYFESNKKNDHKIPECGTFCPYVRYTPLPIIYIVYKLYLL